MKASQPPLSLYTVSLNSTPMDWEGNLNSALIALNSIRKNYGNKPGVVLFPELSISGYGLEDYFFSNSVLKQATRYTNKLARQAHDLLPDSLIFCGLPFEHNNCLYNVMAGMHNGSIIGLNAKHQLANEGLHYEARFFRPWPFFQNLETRFLSSKTIIGSPLYEWHDILIGIEICRDSWVADRPLLMHQNQAIDLVLNPSASHFSFGKYDLRKKLVIESSRQFKCMFAQVNLLGNESGKIIFDGASLASTNGKIIHECRGFSFQDFIVHQIDILPDANRVASRKSAASYKTFVSNIKPDSAAWNSKTIIIEKDQQKPKFIHFTNNSSGSESDSTKAASDSKSDSISKFRHKPVITGSGDCRLYNEFLLSVSLGLFDYLRKSGSRGFVISLSGGADSAVCALLVHRMVALALKELGLEILLKRIDRQDLLSPITQSLKIDGKQDIDSTDSNKEFLTTVNLISNNILTTVYQATDQSGKITRLASRKLARELCSSHSEISINAIVKNYTRLTESLLNRTLDWESDDLTLQNIQARVRSPMAWMLANATGKLLMATGNRNEISVGYCTMDGDTSGGISPIGGISKSFIRKFLIFMQQKGDMVCGNVDSLKLIVDQKPTAELRPANKNNANQTDEDDLMPYDILNKIEEMAIRDLKSPIGIFHILINDKLITEYTHQQIKDFIIKFFNLWTRNQWKRERLAPAFHLDDYSLDPGGWARFPILSKGFEMELDELKKLD